MLLSIDRVLQLLAEGKSLEKISEMASCTPEDVSKIVEQGRTILAKYEKQVSRKKIILKKKEFEKREFAEEDETSLIFSGSELSAVPVDSILTIYLGAFNDPAKTTSGFGITIHDKEDRQVGKVSYFCGKCSETMALYRSVLRAVKIGNYFNSKTIKIRNDNETFLKQASGEIVVEDPSLKRIIDEISGEMRKGIKYLFEPVSKVPVEKAKFLAKRAIEKRDEK